jgi:hypothetical protein
METLILLSSVRILNSPSHNEKGGFCPYGQKNMLVKRKTKMKKDQITTSK